MFSRTPQEHTCHVRQVLHRLLENRLFVKAEKCVFHATSVEFLSYILEKGRVRADPKKVRAVEEWERPTDRTQLRRFLGFANFYRRFIQGFSQVAAPLSALTSTLRPFSWSPEAEAAFSSLKSLFTSAPVLIFPDPGRQFIVEVDALDVGIGAVLSQRSEEDQLIHPVAFLSRRFTPAEWNYDVGNWELLAVHAALEEWRHWLEGAQHPILIWTDHKNLTYIRNAKRLGPRQARWALLFSRFNFTLTFRPGSKNVRADALSRLFSTETQPQSSDQHTFLPPARVIGVVTWGVGCSRGPARPTRSRWGPRNCLFVPASVRSRVLQWGHSSRLACHPGAIRTAQFVHRRFWWPSLEADVREFVAACDICARSKTSHRPPARRPTPTASHPRSTMESHIAL